jgi:hypothetical protein
VLQKGPKRIDPGWFDRLDMAYIRPSLRAPTSPAPRILEEVCSYFGSIT